MFKNYLIGLKAYFISITLIQKLGLWRYFIIPIAISIIIAFAIGFAAWGWSDNLGNYIASIWPWEWGMENFQAIGEILGSILIILLGLIFYKHILLALSAPFMSPVSEKIEVYLTGKPLLSKPSNLVRQLWRGIRVNMRNLILELLISIPILLLGFIPVVGIIAAPILFLVQAYYAGFGNMDYTLERHLNYRKSISFVRTHSGIAMGNGTVFMLLLFIPVIGIIMVLPFSVTAGSAAAVQLLYANESN